jgi:diacylglycerol kinase family enzyme
MERPPIEAAEHLVVLYNPESTRSEETAQLVASLRERYSSRLGFIALETKADADDNRKQLYEQVPKGSILCLIGGDGLVNNTVEAVYHADAPEHLRDTPILPIGGGNKNDMAHMTHGRWGWRNPFRALERGKIISIYPMEASFQPAPQTDGSEQDDAQPFRRLAVYSLGLGVIGKIAHRLNERAFREEHKQRGIVRRLWAEARLLGRTIRETRPFSAVGENIKDNKAFGLIVANGRIMGGSFRLPVKLTAKEMFVAITGRKTFSNLARGIAALLTGFGWGHWRQGSYNFELGEDVPASADGEGFVAPKGKVHITHTDRPFNLVVSKKRRI